MIPALLDIYELCFCPLTSKYKHRKTHISPLTQGTGQRHIDVKKLSISQFSNSSAVDCLLSRRRPEKHSHDELKLHLNSHLSLSCFLFIGDFLLEEFFFPSVSQGCFFYTFEENTEVRAHLLTVSHFVNLLTHQRVNICLESVWIYVLNPGRSFSCLSFQKGCSDRRRLER